MDPMKLKSKILEDLMGALDEEDGNKLMKLKKPSMVAAKVTIAKPMDKEMPMGEDMPKIHEDDKEPMVEMPEMDKGEYENEGEEPQGIMDLLEDISELKDLPPEMKMKLMKFLK
jgi:hypothetical protein